MEAPHSNSHFEKTFLLMFFSLVFTKVVCVVFSNVFVLFRFWIWIIKFNFFHFSLFFSCFFTFPHYHFIYFFGFFPCTSFLCFLSFVLLLPPHLFALCYFKLPIFLPCATANSSSFCLVLPQTPHLSALCYLKLLLHLLPHWAATSLPCFIASSHYLVCCLIALPCHCIVHYLIALSHYLATSPCCLVTLPHYPTSLPSTLSCYHCPLLRRVRCSLFHWLA